MSDGMPSEDAQFETVREDLRLITERLGDARTLLGQGDLPEMDGLQTEVGRVCGEARKLAEMDVPEDFPPRVGLLGDLQAMMDALDVLESDMRVAHENMTDSMDDMSARQRAVTAYGKAPPSQPPEPPKPRKPPRR